jgi:hypothetical protein
MCVPRTPWPAIPVLTIPYSRARTHQLLFTPDEFALPAIPVLTIPYSRARTYQLLFTPDEFALPAVPVLALPYSMAHLCIGVGTLHYISHRN